MARKRSGEAKDAAVAKAAKVTAGGKKCTVEEYLQEQCDTLIQGLNKHADRLVSKLRQELENSCDELKKVSIQKNSRNSDVQETIHVVLEVKTGPYAGEKFEAAKNTVYVGRSTGKKFREKGLSLPKDAEVSTTHGKIEEKKGKIYYTDTGSTNGSAVDGVDVDQGDPHELQTGVVLRVGNTELLTAIIKK